MPLRPAVQGLVKHQIYVSRAKSEADQMTLWTFKAGYPVADARIAYETGALDTWLRTYWQTRTVAAAYVDRIKTWDMGVAPPHKVHVSTIVPAIHGGLGNAPAPQALQAVVALRTQPQGSNVRDRNNGRLAHGHIPLVDVNGDLYVNSNGQYHLDFVYERLRVALSPASSADSGMLSVVSWRHGHGWRAVPLVTPVDHIIPRAQLGVQRRRTPKVGPYARGA